LFFSSFFTMTQQAKDGANEAEAAKGGGEEGEGRREAKGIKLYIHTDNGLLSMGFFQQRLFDDILRRTVADEAYDDQ
jgi:hypothetical protein